MLLKPICDKIWVEYVMHLFIESTPTATMMAAPAMQAKYIPKTKLFLISNDFI